MRNFAEVMDKMIAVIPEKHQVRAALERVKEASTFKAPELMMDCWHTASALMESMITPAERKTEWAIKIRDIFADRI